MGFEIYMLSGLNVWSQARLFNSAGVIVGSHGGGLTNLVFCNPGTKVLEFFPRQLCQSSLPGYMQKSGLKYEYLVFKADELTALISPYDKCTADLPSLEAIVKALLVL